MDRKIRPLHRHKSLIYNIKIIIKLYDHVKEGNVRRMRNTCDTAAILKGENLVQFTKSRRIRWLRCVKITDRERQQKRILYGKIRGVRQWVEAGIGDVW